MAEILKERPRLLDSIPASFFLADIHTRILYANQQSELFFGYTREELEGERLRILFFEEDLIYFLPNIVFLALYKNGFEGEILLKQKQGTKIFVHLSASSFKEGGEVFLTFYFQEIQRLKTLERERLEMERWAGLGKMVEDIAHQIRNPISSIGGYTRRLAKNFSAAKGKVYLERIQKDTCRLETILNRVEEYIRLPRPKFRREKIQEVVEAVLPEFHKKAVARNILFRLDNRGLEGDGQFFMDADLIQRALTHLLENSMEAASQVKGKKEKVIEVSLFDDEDNVGMTIADRGPGISKKNLSLIFDPFFSTSPARVGLGLTFVRRVVEEHRGRIRVDSRPQSGTRVTLYFPKDRRRKLRREFLSPEAGQKSAEA